MKGNIIMKKFELTTESIEKFGRKLFRIRALINFGNVKAGDLGGYLEKESNLSHDGSAWVYDNACVFGNAHVFGNACVFENAEVYDSAKVFGDAEVRGCVQVRGYAKVFENAYVSERACVSGNARVYENVCVADNASVSGNALVSGHALVSGNVQVIEHTVVSGDVVVSGNAQVTGNAFVSGDVQILNDALIKSKDDYIFFKGFGSENRSTTMFRLKNNEIFVKCGCFHGTLQEFEDKVKETHNGNKYAKEYLACVEAAKIHFGI